MSRLLLVLSLIALVFLGIGTAREPNNAMFWLASGSVAYQWVRGILSFLLFVQFVTDPPRKLWFRVLAGTVASVVGVWAMVATYSFRMQGLDTLAFLSTSLAVLVTALERTKVPAGTDFILSRRPRVA